MIISHKYKFIFIKTKKTAGTSIELFLSNILGDDDIITPIFPNEVGHLAKNYIGSFNPFRNIKGLNFQDVKANIKDSIFSRKFYNHIPSVLIKSRVDDSVWNSYYKFCFERNPWDKSISHFFMQKEKFNKSLTISEYFSQNNFCLNYPLYTSNKGEVMVDYIAKYENLNEELFKIFSKLGIEFNGKLNQKAKANYRDKTDSPKAIFTDAQIEQISDVFKFETNLLKYKYSNT